MVVKSDYTLRSSFPDLLKADPPTVVDENGNRQPISNMRKNTILHFYGGDVEAQYPKISDEDQEKLLNEMQIANIDPNNYTCDLPETSVYHINTVFHDEVNNETKIYRGNAIFIGDGIFLSVSHNFQRPDDVNHWTMKIYAIETSKQMGDYEYINPNDKNTVHLRVKAHLFSPQVDNQVSKAVVIPTEDDLAILSRTKGPSPLNAFAALPPSSIKLRNERHDTTLIVYNGYNLDIVRSDAGTAAFYAQIDIPMKRAMKSMKLLCPMRRSISTGKVWEGFTSLHKPVRKLGGPVLLSEMSSTQGSSGGGYFLCDTKELLGINVGDTSDGVKLNIEKQDMSTAVRITNDKVKKWIRKEIRYKLIGNKTGPLAKWSEFGLSA